MLGELRRGVSPFVLRRCFHDVRQYKEDIRWPGWQVIIGIETHAQIKVRQKLFSNAFNATLGEAPNTHVSPFDAAFPGTLPRLNHRCVDLAIRTSVALQCDIQTRSSFDRKHYFYPDLPSGYQITQYYAPIALNGCIEVVSPDLTFPVRIKQIQLEQDTAKSTVNPRSRASQLDLNRAGAGLMEIVTEPDIRTPEEAGTYVRTLQSILRAVGASDGNMEEGSLRCDVNVSINRVGRPLGTRCEIKNLNSIRFMMAAIMHEIHRQRVVIESAPDPETATVPQETRGFDEHSFETYRLRSKEDAPDYRYMPDPNLGTLVLSKERISQICRDFPELPSQTRGRLREQFGLPERDIDVLLTIDSERKIPFDGESLQHLDSAEAGAVAYFDKVCTKQRDPKVVVNWMIHELIGKLSARGESFKDNKVTASQLGQLIDLVEDGVITRTSGKHLLRHLLENPTQTTALQVAQDLGLTAFSHSPIQNASADCQKHDVLLQLCAQAIVHLPAEVESFRRGNANVLNRIVGHVMKASRGRADAKAAGVIIARMINEPKQ
ncbi:Glutamyl-tRNA amidotransferase subunit B, mitochondrial [Amanita muscaria]